MQAFRQRVLPEGKTEIGPASLLLAALAAGQAEIEALVALVPEAERGSRVVMEGGWTLQDLIGHITDWEAFGLGVLRTGRIPRMGFGGDDDLWNEAHRQVRKGQPWHVTWADYQRIRRDFVAQIESIPAGELDEVIYNQWGRNPSRYGWIVTFQDHEREHAFVLRRHLLPDLPSHLLTWQAG